MLKWTQACAIAGTQREQRVARQQKNDHERCFLESQHSKRSTGTDKKIYVRRRRSNNDGGARGEERRREGKKRKGKKKRQELVKSMGGGAGEVMGNRKERRMRKAREKKGSRLREGPGAEQESIERRCMGVCPTNLVVVLGTWQMLQVAPGKGRGGGSSTGPRRGRC